MHLLRIALAALLLAFAGPSAVAEEAKGSGVGANDVGEIEATRRDNALRMLTRLDAKLLGVVVGGDDRFGLSASLRAQQKAWSTYMISECELVGMLVDAGSPWQAVRAVRCEANLSEQRVVRVRAAIRCVQRLPEDQRRLEQGTCLYQLAPLAVPLRP